MFLNFILWFGGNKSKKVKKKKVNKSYFGLNSIYFKKTFTKSNVTIYKGINVTTTYS